MNIAFLTPEYPHPRIGPAGGIGTGIFNLARGLVKLGHQPVVLVYGQDRDAYFEEGNIGFYLIRNVKFKGLSWLLTRKKIQFLINSLHAKGKIDIVEAPDWTGISAFVKTRCPMVIRLNGSDTYFCHLDKRPVKPFTKFLEKAAIRQADGLISVSDYTARVTNQVFGLDNTFKIIPNSIEPAGFVSSAEEPDPHTVLYFGTLIRKKGLLELPAIFNLVIEKNPEAKLVLAGRDSADIATGSPSTWEMMQPMFSARAKTRVSYLGPVDYNLVPELISKAAVCVFPTFAEAFPLSWLEAMAMEKAIVASGIGWAPEMIQDGVSGFLAHPTDHAEFAAKIASLLSDASLRETLGKNARQRVVENFDNRIIAQQSVDYYSTLL